MGSVGLDVSKILHVKRPLHILIQKKQKKNRNNYLCCLIKRKKLLPQRTNELELQTFWADARNIHNSRPSNRVSNVND